ncbi:bifunctional adenosylcobinamide kinase/adenosylcobinamide-phosphate guanylyltransferase [Mangrovibacillus sp. Mu-81]|uniref:bifunctional adenosylcobinamide kinase/adenosylcobinamide-phosphate guanylyltransferase n=1 Tax=Mangrovibacillus sp. Mu-81 TaxID=3121478 RepID=UPI002FE4A452
MQFVTGGAFNGKSEWVRKTNKQKLAWLKGSEELTLPQPDSFQNTVVLEGFEYLILNEVRKEKEIEMIRSEFQSLFEKWMNWEETSASRNVIWIGSDIGRGIVPVDPAERKWRDLTGWVYQDLVKLSDHVYEIWFGLPQRLK